MAKLTNLTPILISSFLVWNPCSRRQERNFGTSKCKIFLGIMEMNIKTYINPNFKSGFIKFQSRTLWQKFGRVQRRIQTSFPLALKKELMQFFINFCNTVHLNTIYCLSELLNILSASKQQLRHISNNETLNVFLKKHEIYDTDIHKKYFQLCET